jgi:hypothetical protein
MIQQRLREIPFDDHTECPEEFLAFYHPENAQANLRAQNLSAPPPADQSI